MMCWARLKSVDVHVSPLITLETANADHVLLRRYCYAVHFRSTIHPRRNTSLLGILPDIEVSMHGVPA